MSKLKYRTKNPKKGYSFYESNACHELTDMWDKLPPKDVQLQALEIVNDALENLLTNLDRLGYDATKARFSIHFKR